MRMDEYLMLHIVAFSIGILLDCIIGDPYWMPHPIRWIGRFIGFLDRKAMGEKTNISTNPARERRQGRFICTIVILVTVLMTSIIVIGTYIINIYAGVAVESVLTCYILAARSLSYESMKVYRELEGGNLEGARHAVSMIVGRDTQALDEEGVAKAAVETVAENASDGVIAPLIYTFLGGPILGFMYKAVNTMDSMIGYHNDRYEHLGRAAARLDDVLNYLPSRISALYFVISAFIISVFSKYYSGADAFKIWKRDRRNHKSPNSAQTESACAGALGLQLAGDAFYFGKLVSKPYIGDYRRTIEAKDIKRSGALMFLSEFLCFGTMVAIFFLVRILAL